MSFVNPMNPERKEFIKLIIFRRWSNAYKILNGMEMKDMLWALASIQRTDLDLFWNYRIRLVPEPAAMLSEPVGLLRVDHFKYFTETINLPRIGYAIDVVKNRKLPKAPKNLKTTEIADAQMFIFGQKAQQLIFSEDPTGGLLPAPNLNAPKLSQADYETAAAELGVETEIIQAVAAVETRDNAFDSQGRPKILFEAHYFQKFTGRKFALTHPHLSQPNDSGSAKYYSWDQWSRMYEAMTLDYQAAWKSASWGRFQIMGANHTVCGRNIYNFVDGMFNSEQMHLKIFMEFCRGKNLVRHLKTKNWTDFALGYNGPNQKGYDTKMASEYAKIQKLQTK